MNLLFAYVDRVPDCRELTEIVREELEHFELVIDLLARRGIPYRKLTPAATERLTARADTPERSRAAVDRMLIAGLIEARSCERFDLLAKNVADPNWPSFIVRSLRARHGITARTSGWRNTFKAKRRFTRACANWPRPKRRSSRG